MLLGIIVFMSSCIGIYGFYNDLYILTYISFILCLFENVLGRLTGASKSMSIFFVSCLIGWIIEEKFWIGIAVGGLFENVITFIGGCLLVAIIGSSDSKKEVIDNNSNNSNKNAWEEYLDKYYPREGTGTRLKDIKEKENENIVNVMQEVIDKAKKDLSTGIKREELKQLLDNGSITTETYNDVLKSIEALEATANMDINILKDLEK